MSLNLFRHGLPCGKERQAPAARLCSQRPLQKRMAIFRYDGIFIHILPLHLETSIARYKILVHIRRTLLPLSSTNLDFP